MDVSVNDRQVVNTTIDIRDLVEDIDLTLQVHGEAYRGMHGLLLDAFYVKLSDDAKTFPIPAVPGGTVVLTPELAMTILEVGGILDPKGDQESFQLLYGARIIDQRADIDAQFTLGGPPVNRSYEPGDTVYDGLVGARWIKRFGRGWGAVLRADVSAGGTEFTWNANTMLAYSFGKDGRFAVMGGYRRMEVEFKEKDSVESEMTLSGPIVGFRFAF